MGYLHVCVWYAHMRTGQSYRDLRYIGLRKACNETAKRIAHAHIIYSLIV